MKDFLAWRASLWSLLTLGAASFVIQPRADNNKALAASSGNIALNPYVPCCAGTAGGYTTGGRYDASFQLVGPLTVVDYIEGVIPLLRKRGDFFTPRGREDIAHPISSTTTVSLSYTMDPQGSATLTYTQCAEALRYLLLVLKHDVFAEPIKYEIQLHISVGNDQKILVTVKQDEPQNSHAKAGSNLEFSAQTYRDRPMSRGEALESLAAAEAIYNQPGALATVVPEGYAQGITRGGVRYQMNLELDETQKKFGWPRFTFADLVDLGGAIRNLLGTGPDTWPAFYAELETERDGIAIGEISLEPVPPNGQLLNSENSTQPTLSLPGNSSDASPVSVT